MEKYECPFVYWEETDYDVLSGHSSYEPVCTKECNKGKHCYKYNYTWCKYRYLDDIGNRIDNPELLQNRK